MGITSVAARGIVDTPGPVIGTIVIMIAVTTAVTTMIATTTGVGIAGGIATTTAVGIATGIAIRKLGAVDLRLRPVRCPDAVTSWLFRRG